MLKVVIFASDQSLFLNRKLELSNCSTIVNSILWCDSGALTRTSFINENLNTWLLFLDHDCILKQEVLEKIKTVLCKDPVPQDRVFSGLYLNSATASYMQKVHNFIANTWLEQSFSFDACNKLLLGGAFLIFNTKKIETDVNDLFWGAEDKLLSYELNSLGYQFVLLKEFRIIHDTSASLYHFIKRAWLHGINEVRYLKSENNKINYLFWIRKIGFVNLHLLPLILLHFCIQKGALLIQRALPLNKQ